MAAGGRIIALMVVLCAILPLLASAVPPSSDQEFNELKFRSDDDDYPPIQDDDSEAEEEDGDNTKRIRVVQKAEKKDNDKKGKKKGKNGKKGKKPVAPGNEDNKPVVPGNEAANKAAEPAPGGLRVGFYQQTCPQAERIIKETMDKIFERNVKIAPALIRLFFHDCFVTGCDASVLLERTPSGEKTEREAPQNGVFVKGYEEIEEIKAALEAECPGIVSCADTLAYATREALAQNGVQRYDVAAGRRDRPVSLAVNAERDLPFPDAPAQENIKLFERKGMTIDDLVVLIGSHSIGECHCTVYEGRFQDPEKRKDINPSYLDQLHVQSFCVDQDQTLPFDRMSQNIMDAGFYKQLLAKETLLESDHNLVVEPNTNAIMKRYADDQEGWMARFIQAITKMGEIEVLTGDQGEIRKQCRAFN